MTDGTSGSQAFPELGFYLLAGQPKNSRDLVTEVQQGEEMGFGTAFISERYNGKEVLSLCGAAGAVSERIRIASGVTQHNVRHPLVTAGFLSTMVSLTNGRFMFGLGRGIQLVQQSMGYKPIRNAELVDFVDLMRKLLHGERIVRHTGPAGEYPYLNLGLKKPVNVPFGIAAFADSTLRLGGKHFDEVILHTFFTDTTTRRCVDLVKQSAKDAGRDPDSVKVWACLATIGDHIPYGLRLKKSVARMATYLQVYGDLLVKTNGWDATELQRFREHPLIQAQTGPIDALDSPQQLENIAQLIPPEWMASAAMGTPAQCVATVKNQFALGCDGVILHGCTPTELAPVMDTYAASKS